MGPSLPPPYSSPFNPPFLSLSPSTPPPLPPGTERVQSKYNVAELSALANTKPLLSTSVTSRGHVGLGGGLQLAGGWFSLALLLFHGPLIEGVSGMWHTLV